MSNEQILIVDDQPINLALARVLLDIEGYDVRTASDPEEALTILEGGFHPRLILMDIQLPGIDGLELTRRLRTGPNWHGTVIVALTAYAMKGDEERMLAAGCDGYIAKPIDTRTLAATVAGYLQGGARPGNASPQNLPGGRGISAARQTSETH